MTDSFCPTSERIAKGRERLCNNMSGTSEVPRLADPLCAPGKSAEVGQKPTSGNS
jgi:hypothetical protein